MKYPTFEITDEGRDLLDDNSKQDWSYQPGYSEQLGALDRLSKSGQIKCNILREFVASYMPKEEWQKNMGILESKGLIKRV